ncbi:hypothetical protein [Aminiphilus circumscriptus]|uniref:hypothetical protein n=1 Tax=Aminiphilus circumscriptus TaxID=290732 RepID=UPI0004B12408|nr:hypothetical protein [Aminiphilus circumscriptus]
MARMSLRLLTLCIFLLVGVSVPGGGAGAAFGETGEEPFAVYLKNETLGLGSTRIADPEDPGDWYWTCAAHPGDEMLLLENPASRGASVFRLDEKRIGTVKVVLHGERSRVAVVPRAVSADAVRFVWPSGFAPGERVLVSLEGSLSLEARYTMVKNWITRKVAGDPSPASADAVKNIGAFPRHFIPAGVLNAGKETPLLLRVNADPVTNFLHIRGQNLKGQCTVRFPDGTRQTVDNTSPFTLRVPYVYGMDAGPLSVEFTSGEVSNSLFVRFPRKVAGLLAFPEGEVAETSRIALVVGDDAAEDAFEERDFLLREDGSFVIGMDNRKETESLSAMLRCGDGSFVELARTDVPPEETHVLLVIAPETLALVRRTCGP